MIANTQKQPVGVLEQSTLPSMQDDVEHSPPDETADPSETYGKNSVPSSPDSYTSPPNRDEQTRCARIEAIKTRLARKQYHVNPRSLAHALYEYSTKRHQ